MPVVNRQKERELVQKARGRGYSDEQIKQIVLKYREQNAPKPQEQKQSFLQEAASDIGEGLSNLKQSFSRRVGEVKSAFQRSTAGEQNPLETSLQTIGQAAGAVGDVVGEALMTGAKAILPQSVEENVPQALRNTVKKVTLGVVDDADIDNALSAISGGFQKYEAWKSQNPRAASNLESVVNISSLFPAGKAATTTARQATRAAGDVVDTVSDAARKVTTATQQTAKSLAETPRALAKAVPEVASSTARGVGKFLQKAPERISTAVDERRVARSIVNALPENAKNAVDEGILLRDAQTIVNASDAEKNIFRQMTQAAEKFSINRRDVDPAEFVGKEMRRRISEADNIRGDIGERLGEVAKKFDNVEISDSEIKDAVLKRLQREQGLKNLKVDEEGLLDFSDTTLSSALTRSDRNVIQQAWNEITGRNASRLHKFRQELFESLGGKKRSMANYTETQEKALEAIRAGIADTLESVSKEYKTLNAQYRAAAEPMRRIRRLFKNLDPNASTDILDMRAATLARRLTGNSVGGQEILDIINQIDSILGAYGKSVDVDLGALQDYLNGLNRYYDIAGDTGSAGQINLGLRGLSLGDVAMRGVEAAKQFTSPTQLSKQKALRKLLDL